MNNITKILLIEDDPKIANFMSLALTSKGYRISLAQSAYEGIRAYNEENPHIIILDLGLPDADGNVVISEVRKTSGTPILIVSARGLETDKINALDAGANDYITKPFSLGEFLARVRVMERIATQKSNINPVYKVKNLVLDTEKRRVFLDDNEIHLTRLEYKLLTLLVTNCGKVITHSQIFKEVWGYDEAYDAKSIRVCMASLRRKIEKDTSNPQFIFTEVGVGYRFVDIED